MDVFEIAGYVTGVDNSGVTFLNPADAFNSMSNGYVYRQVLQSRLGFTQFANRLSDNDRVMGIYENTFPDGGKETLVFTKNNMFVYNEGTNQFDIVAFNSATGVTAFGISGNSDYISGTSYFTKDGTQRFVFTSRGMDTAMGGGVYFYTTFADGIKVFTNVVDNPDYLAPGASIGNLLKATRVIWFGERINFFAPLTDVAPYNQGILYSGIRDSSGNGDKFNVVGSGLTECDTYEYMAGAIISGDVVVMNFAQSNWILVKTTDVFNPYVTKQIPSVLGTDAGFSAVFWSYSVKSLGQTACITTDTRQSVRFDNKQPYFTQDYIEEANFDLTYGGYDRKNEQFLFAYRSVNTQLDDITQDKVLGYTYTENSWFVNDQRFSCFGQSTAGQNLVWNDIDETINPSWARWDTTEEIWNKIGINKQVQKTLAGDNYGYVYQINDGYNDYYSTISAVAQGATTTFTIEETAYQVNDIVTFENVGGLEDESGNSAFNGKFFTVLSVTDTTIEVNSDSTTFTAYTTGGAVSKPIAFNAVLSPFNPYRPVGRKCIVSHVEFLINTNCGGITVKCYTDEGDDPFKTAQLIPSVNYNVATKEWITISINQETNFLTLELEALSADNQVIITSTRIHCEKGQLTTS